MTRAFSHTYRVPGGDLAGQFMAQVDLVSVLQRLPYMALIVNAGREVVFANQALLALLGLEDLVNALSRRPGELLQCVNSQSSAAGCGSAEGCRHCQVAQVVAEVLASGRGTEREARLTARRDGRLTAYDFKVTAAPLEFGTAPLAMVFLEDISAVKRREHLESIFLHDLANSIGCLQLLTELHDQDPERIRHDALLRHLELLTDEIRAQQILLDAEQGRLCIDTQCVPVEKLLGDVLAGLAAYCEKNRLAVATELPLVPVYLATDRLLAQRVLQNAVKNALEASLPGDRIKVSVADREATVAITVWNPAVMTASTQHQVFQRSFSTKGKGRGLGTYSMRLLLENYLDGAVEFCSEPAGGTVFTITLPSMRGYLSGRG